MRKTRRIIFLFICPVVAMASLHCRKDKNKLPPETQVGNNSFGCLIDGQVFKPKGRIMSPAYDCYYQRIYPGDDGYVFNVSGSLKDGDCQIKSIIIAVDSIKLTAGTYRLGNSVRGKFAAGYDYYKNCNTDAAQFYTTAIDSGMLVIKKFDEINSIVSGTFWFNATNASGAKVEIREGRFDMKF